MEQTEKPLIVLSAGGTGGHVFPAEALTRELLGRGFNVALFTDIRGDKFSGDLPVPVHRIRSGYLGKGLISKAKGVVEMGLGIFQSVRLMKKLRPAAVVGFGGYPSVPAVYAGWREGIPVILHEQNAVLGRANRAMMTKAKCVATSFPHVDGLRIEQGTTVAQTGNPVRPVFAALRASPYSPVSDNGPIRILVLGGSLGASVFSRVVPKALGQLPEHLRHRIIVSQQCRAEDLENAKASFAGAGVEAELSTFFRDVPERMAQSHLVICRSGGSTIAELTAIGRPSILVPFPHGHAGEQMANAEAIADAGGAWLIPEHAFTPEALAVRIEALLTLPSNLEKAAAAARAWGTISAADNLADCVQKVIGFYKN